MTVSKDSPTQISPQTLTLTRRRLCGDHMTRIAAVSTSAQLREGAAAATPAVAASEGAVEAVRFADTKRAGLAVPGRCGLCPPGSTLGYRAHELTCLHDGRTILMPS